MAPPRELPSMMFSLGQRFALLIIAAALLLAFTAPAASAYVSQIPQPQETTETPAPAADQQAQETPEPTPGETPREPTASETAPEPTKAETTPEPTQGEATPEPTQGEVTPEPTPRDDPPEPTAEPTAEPIVEPVPEPRPAQSAGESGRYQVERGDTLYSIARRHGITVAELQSANGLTGTGIQAGQTLIIPTGSDSPDPTATPTPTPQATAAPALATPSATPSPVGRPSSTETSQPPSPDTSGEETGFRETAERYTEQFLRWIEPLISGVPPFVFVGGLVGVMNSCLFYLVLGRSLKLFLPFVLMGAFAAVIGVTVSRQIPESGPMIGEVDLVAASIATWITLLIARSFRL